MTTQTQLLLALWVEARTRFSNQLESFTEDDLKKKLLPSQNSIGFLIRHIGDVEWLFAKNVFGATTYMLAQEPLLKNTIQADGQI